MIKLSECETITDEKLFVESHEAVIKFAKDQRIRQLCLDRLNLYYKIKNENN